MKINSSNVGMESDRTYRSVATRKLSASVSIMTEGAAGVQTAGRDRAENLPDSLKGGSSRAESVRHAYQKLAEPVPLNRMRQIEKGMQQKTIESIRRSCIIHLWELLFGKEAADELTEQYSLETEPSLSPDSPAAADSSYTFSVAEKNGFQEYESVRFSTDGTVVTDDGRSIRFKINVSLSRRFAAYVAKQHDESVTFCDPLVLHLQDSPGCLSDQTFFFDLNCDGKKEELSLLKEGNAFLACDRNDDGIINDGSELFGSRSGDGFKDLELYDEDQNGWIDENDAVFSRLGIWVMDDSGNNSLYRLKEKGIGAICLKNVSSEFALRSGSTGRYSGFLRKTGIFLYENGTASTISHVDMVSKK